MTVIDHLNELWTGLLHFLSTLIIPDWGALIGLLPLFLVLGVIGPIVSILALGWFIYMIRRPLTPVRYAEGPRPAPLDEDGKPIFPVGLPHCLREGLIFASGTNRCPNDGDELWVVCRCAASAARRASTRCGECGLVLKVANRPVTIGPLAEPPPGGRAIA